MSSRWSRFLTIGLGLAGFLLLLFQALELWLSHPATQAKLAAWLASRLKRSLGYEVQVAEARLQLLPLQIAVKGVRIGPANAPLLAVDGAQLNLGSVKFTERELVLNLLYLKGLRISPEGLWPRAASAGGGRLVRVRIRQLVVTGASLSGYSLAPGMVLSFEDLELLVSGRRAAEPQNAYLRVGRLRLQNASAVPLALAIQGRAQLSQEQLSLQHLKVSGDGLQGDIQGIIRWQGKVQASLRGEVRAEMAEVDGFFGLGIGLRGMVESRAEAQITGQTFTLDARLGGKNVTVAGFTLEHVQASVHVSPDGVEALLEEGLFAGGRLEGSYQLADFGPTFAHKVALRGEGVDVERFLSYFGVPAAGLAASARLNADLAFDGAAIGKGQGTAFVHLARGQGEVPLEGELAVALGSDALHFQGRRLHLGGGNLTWQGSLSLGTWLPDWSLRGEGIQVEAAAKLLAGWIGAPILPRELSGTSVFDLTLQGPFTSPTLLGTVALSPVCLGPLDADALEGELHFSSGVLHLVSGRLVLGEGRAQFAGELDIRPPSPAVSLSFSGKDLPLWRMAAWAGLKFPLTGAVTLEGTVGGTLQEPLVEAQMRLKAVTVVGLVFGEGHGGISLEQGLLRVTDLKLGGLSGSLIVDFPQRQVDLSARVRGLGLEPISPILDRLLGGEVEAELEGEFPWDEPSGRLTLRTPQGTSGSLTLGARGLAAFLERPGRWQLSAEISRSQGAFTGSATFDAKSLAALVGDLWGQPPPFEGHVRAEMSLAFGAEKTPTIEGRITEASLTAEGEELTLAEPAGFLLRGSDFDLQNLNMIGPSARLELRGHRFADGRLSGNVSSLIPASLLGVLWPETRPRGQVELVGQVSGTDAAPRMEGVLHVSKASLELPGLPAPVTNIQGTAELVGETITFENVGFALSGGTGTCSGQLRLYPRLELDLGFTVQAVRWPLTQGFESKLDGELRLSGDLAKLELSGKVSLRRSVYQRDVNLQRLVLEELLGRERAASPEKGIVAFHVRIDVPGTLEVRTPMARLVAQGTLHLVGDSNAPGLLGRLEVVPGGEIELSGTRYEIDRASVSFSDPNSIRPLLDLQAHGTVQNFTVNVGLVGTLDRLVPSLSSDPPLPEADILALIALGVSPGSSAASASASAMATSFLTEQLTGIVTERTRTLLALDQLRIDPFITTETGTPTARATLVKQLSPDWSVTVSTNLSSNREEVVVSRWRVSKDVFLEATRDTDGSYSLEIRWRRRY